MTTLPDRPKACARVKPMRWWDIEQIAALEKVLFPTDSPWTPAMFWSELASRRHYVVVRDAASPLPADRPSAGSATGDRSSAGGRSAGSPSANRTAVRDGAVLGYAGLAVTDEEAEVQTIGVRPDRQGHGIGRLLLDDLIRASGDRRILLDVRTDNAPAIGLYRSVGFVPIGLRKRYYHPSGADAYRMSRVGGRPV